MDQMDYPVHSICVMRFRSFFELSSPATSHVEELTLGLSMIPRWKMTADPRVAKRSGDGPSCTVSCLGFAGSRRALKNVSGSCGVAQKGLH